MKRRRWVTRHPCSWFGFWLAWSLWWGVFDARAALHEIAVMMHHPGWYTLAATWSVINTAAMVVLGRLNFGWFAKAIGRR
jgi:hypothetical protein